MPTPTSENSLPAIPGSYILILALNTPHTLQIGRLGEFEFPAGGYAYCGSAQGPGGLAARVQRHLRPATQKATHWHIDYLAAIATIPAVFWLDSARPHECSWAARLGQHGRCYPARFGASDCHCAGHLIQFTDVHACQSAIHLLHPPLHQSRLTARHGSPAF